MFCGKCGTENADGAVFCKNCGEPFGAQGTAPAGGQGTVPMGGQNGMPIGNNGSVSSDDKNKKVGIIVSVVAVAIVLIIGFNLFSGRGYKSTVKQFISSIEKADGEKLLKLVPDEVLEKLEDESDLDRDEMEKNISKGLEVLEKKYGDDFEISYDIKSEEDLDDEDLEDIQDEYDDEDIEIKIKAAKKLKIKMVIKYESDDKTKTEKETETLTLIKVGRSWYLDMSSIDSFL